MILSLLYKAEARDVRLILIDPKMLEMSVYEGIPHLLCPVVTDMKQAAHALNWCVGEMERRYKLMSKLGVRQLSGYNRKIEEAAEAGNHIPNPFSLTPELPEPLERLPYVVVVIDELADLMMVVGKKIEELIARLAQKARAAGIHLVLDDVEGGGVQPDEREECDHPAGWDRRLEVRVFGPRCGSEGKSVGRQRADHHGHGRHDRLVRRTRIEDRRQVAERVGGARADPGPESEPSPPEHAPKPADQNHGEPPQAQAHGQRGDHHQEPCLREEGEHGGHAAGSEAVRHGPGVALKAETPSRQQASSHATDAECAEEPAQSSLGQRQRQLHQREFRKEEEIDVRRRDRDDGARHRRPAR
jgi:hypothetical protein